MISRIFTVAILAGAGLVSSQSISSGCESALAGIAASPDAACLNPSALISLVLGKNSSIIGPLDTWLTGLCATGPCSDNSLSAVVTNATVGCSAELSALGLSSTSPSDLISTVEAIYPTIREVVCLRDTSANELCVTELLTAIQNAVGTLSINNLPNIISQVSAGSDFFPSNVTCTNCIKQTYNIVNEAFPSQASALASALSCGSNFTDGSSASGILEIASTSTATSAGSSNAALGASPLMSGGALVGLAISTLIAVSVGFSFLA